MQHQHGDVLINKVKEIPKDCKKLAHKVLMEGEVTGHKHEVISGDAQLFEKEGTLYLAAKTDCVVTHQEHGNVTVKKGNYKIGRVVETDPFSDAVRTVHD